MVVLLDTTTPEALTRCVQQVVRTGGASEVVVVTARALRLPQHLARRTRVTRVASPDQLETAAAAMASTPRTVVVAPTSASFTDGWQEAVHERALEHDQVISMIGAHGRSILLVPEAVRGITGTRTTWLEPLGLRLRGSIEDEVGRQSLSAVMIVKDEEEVLGECLTALEPFVDEIVVYDTGSSDATVEIARRHGVKLVEGFWNDHFGDARNRALEHATGDWVLQIDADEVLTGDVDALRRQLDTETYDQVSLTIVSTTHQGGTTGLETQPARFFRRALYRWTGALHEYPLALPGAAARGMSPHHAPVKIFHSGYQPERTAARDKPNRNLILATKELESTALDDPARATLLSNQGRTLMWAGKVEEALEVFEELRTTPGNPTAITIGGRAALEIVFGLQRVELVEPWLEVLAANGESPGNLAVFRARKHLLVGEPDLAVEAVSSVSSGGGGTDVWGTPFDTSRVAVIEAAARAVMGEAERATELLLDLLRTSPDAVPFDLMLTSISSAGRSLEEVAEAAPDSFVERTLRDAAAMHPVHALAWFEACFATRPGDVRPVVAGNVFGFRAGWRVSLVWALRAIEAGLSDCNALSVLVTAETAPRIERCVAAALLCEYFGASSMAQQFEALTSVLSTGEQEELLVLLGEVGVSTSSVDVTEPVGARA